MCFCSDDVPPPILPLDAQPNRRVKVGNRGPGHPVFYLDADGQAQRYGRAKLPPREHLPRNPYLENASRARGRGRSRGHGHGQAQGRGRGQGLSGHPGIGGRGGQHHMSSEIHGNNEGPAQNRGQRRRGRGQGTGRGGGHGPGDHHGHGGLNNMHQDGGGFGDDADAEEPPPSYEETLATDLQEEAFDLQDGFGAPQDDMWPGQNQNEAHRGGGHHGQHPFGRGRGTRGRGGFRGGW